MNDTIMQRPAVGAAPSSGDKGAHLTTWRDREEEWALLVYFLFNLLKSTDTSSPQHRQSGDK